jgi:hypothetical protein
METKTEKKLVGHKITVKGIYLAKPPKRDELGAAESRKVEYEESFDLPPGKGNLIDTNALSQVLGKNLLADRLLEKDTEFRGIKTHIIVKHENLFE